MTTEKSPPCQAAGQLIIAVSFLVLATYVATEASRTPIAGDHPKASWIGVGLAAFTAPTMPLLARMKRRIGQQFN